MAGNKPTEILFVFHGQKQSKRTRELQDAKRRAHAARQSARRTREVPVEAPSPSSTGSPSGNQELVEAVTPPAHPGPVRRYPILPPFDAILDDQSGGLLESPSASPSPLSLLSQDLTDPFRTTAVGQLPSLLQRYLHDAQTLIWPSLVPLVPREQAAFFYRRSPVDTPTEIDHQIDAAAAIALQYMTVKDMDLANRLIAIGKEHRQRSITWVNSQIANANGPPETKVIAALLTLISHTGLQKPSTWHKYPVSPLIMAEFASLYGSTTVLPEDVRFLHSVVGMKGGEEWIGSDIADQDLPMRLMLNHFDIFIATRRGTQPMWKSIAAIPIDMVNMYNRPLAHDQSATGTCRGFTVIEDDRLRIALDLTRLSVNALEAYRCGSPGAPDYSLVVHMRMFVQHQLLLLYPEDDDPPLQQMDAVIHSAALVFSDMVLFSLSPASCARARLLKELHSNLERIPWSSCQSQTETKVRFWALMILAVGSISRDVVDEYAVAELRQQSSFSVTRASWTHHEAILREFLWWDHNLSAPAYDVWMQVIDGTDHGRSTPAR